MNKAFGALGNDQQSAFTGALVQLMERGNRARDSTIVLPSAYLEVVITKRLA
jgi:hypothetical protein